jgi:radical SAM protein with 4Fe4S-binding SPASM domain
MKRKTGLMETSLFRKVMDEVATYPESVKKKEIELFHFGESLLHPEIAEMNQYAASKGLNTTLSVNAIELNHQLSEKLIRGNAGKIIVSLDGFDTESFLAVRGRKIDYQQAIENIEYASSCIKRLNSKTLLVVRMIELNQNADKTEYFRSFWQDRKIEVEVRQFFPWGEKEMAELGEYEKYPPFMPCPFAWQYTVIQWNGDVVACCRDYNAENIMGNIKDASLEEIWNGKKYHTFRENMVAGKYENSICQPCMDLYYTEES